MCDLDRKVLQEMVVRLVELAQSHRVPAASIAAALGNHIKVEDTETVERFFATIDATIDAALDDARRRDDVILSRDQVARLFRMTPQSVSWHVKQGNLQGVKVRVGGRSRVGVPMSSVCDYFDVTPERRAELTASLPRDADGKPEPVFWEAKVEGKTIRAATIPLGPDGPPPLVESNIRGPVKVLVSMGNGDDSQEFAEVLNTGMIQKVIS